MKALDTECTTEMIMRQDPVVSVDVQFSSSSHCQHMKESKKCVGTNAVHLESR